ncbi:MAG: DUF2490 domain-containing protein [Arcicella sp.]|nr:DUF2490 domain-containing protein [Arcicella sp.]
MTLISFLSIFTGIRLTVYMTKFTITGFTFFLGMAWCSGQTYHHVSSWSRLAVQKEFSEHWSIMADIHWRRQNDFTTSTANPFSLRLMEG